MEFARLESDVKMLIKNAVSLFLKRMKILWNVIIMNKTVDIKRKLKREDKKVTVTTVKKIVTTMSVKELREQIKMLKEAIKRCDSQIENISKEKEQLLKFLAEYKKV